jgi:hypothetical protein
MCTPLLSINLVDGSVSSDFSLQTISKPFPPANIISVDKKSLSPLQYPTIKMCHQELQVEMCSYCGKKNGESRRATIFCPKNPYHDPTLVRHCPGAGGFDGSRIRERIVTYICPKCER